MVIPDWGDHLGPSGASGGRREPRESLLTGLRMYEALKDSLNFSVFFQQEVCGERGEGSDTRLASPGAQSALETAAALRNGSGTENEKDYIGLRV